MIIILIPPTIAEIEVFSLSPNSMTSFGCKNESINYIMVSVRHTTILIAESIFYKGFNHEVILSLEVIYLHAFFPYVLSRK